MQVSLVTNVAVIHISVVHEFFNGCENRTFCSRFAFKMYTYVNNVSLRHMYLHLMSITVFLFVC